MSKQIKFTAEDDVMEIIDRLPYGMRSPFICDCIKFAMKSESKTMQWYKERGRKLPESGSASKLPSNLCEKALTKSKEQPVKQVTRLKVDEVANVAQDSGVTVDAEFG